MNYTVLSHGRSGGRLEYSNGAKLSVKSIEAPPRILVNSEQRKALLAVHVPTNQLGQATANVTQICPGLFFPSKSEI